MDSMQTVLAFILLVGCALCDDVATDSEDTRSVESNYDIQNGQGNAIVDESDIKMSRKDPCMEKTCDAGYECDVDDNGEATCVCIHLCRKDTLQVCSDSNVTFESLCELYRQRCMCSMNRPDCTNGNFRHANLEHFGACRELPPCTEHEMQQFPIRLRDWLFLIMEELAERAELTEEEVKLVKTAELQEKNWILPSIWKFCDLDRSHDRQVTTLELVAMSASLKRYEHCAGPFLEGCDKDKDASISLAEWGDCLQIQPEEMEDRCDQLRKD